MKVFSKPTKSCESEVFWLESQLKLRQNISFKQRLQMSKDD